MEQYCNKLVDCLSNFVKLQERLSLCLDPLFKSDFTDFYAYNAFCKKSKMFGWDFGKCKMHSRQNAFCKFSFLEQKSESKIFWILILASTFNFS
jgi:hypothetical protein